MMDTQTIEGEIRNLLLKHKHKLTCEIKCEGEITQDILLALSVLREKGVKMVISVMPHDEEAQLP